jgi:hypothetical protein
MRLVLISVAFLATYGSFAFAAPKVSPEDAELMRVEALADRAPEHIQGFAPYVLSDPDTAVDKTTGRNFRELDDCSRVPVMTKRSDGKTVRQYADVCD